MFSRGSSIFLIFLIVALTDSAINIDHALDGFPDNDLAIPLEQAPFMVKLRFNETWTFCCGTLISPQHVLTRARCIAANPGLNITVFGGSNERKTGVRREIAEIIMHPSYMASKNYDVVVLKLNKPFEEGPRIQVLNKFCSAPVKAGEYVQAYSFLRDKLINSRLQMISKDECFRSKPTLWKAPLTNTSICAVPELNRDCLILFGGAIVYRGELCGVVSNSDVFCSQPAILTSVYSARNFIEDALKY